jgi:hypothetical protein
MILAKMLYLKHIGHYHSKNQPFKKQICEIRGKNP